MAFDESVAYTWTIRNFSKLTDMPIRSDAFGTRHFHWYLKMYPKGDLKQKDVALESRYISVYVGASPDDCDMRCGWSRQAKYSLTLLHPQGGRKIQREIDLRTFTDASEWGYTTFVSLTALKDQYLKDDTLTLYIEIRYNLSQKIAHEAGAGSGINYCAEFRKLLNNPAYSDVKFGFRSKDAFPSTPSARSPSRLRDAHVCVRNLGLSLAPVAGVASPRGDPSGVVPNSIVPKLGPVAISSPSSEALSTDSADSSSATTDAEYPPAPTGTAAGPGGVGSPSAAQPGLAASDVRAAADDESAASADEGETDPDGDGNDEHDVHEAENPGDADACCPAVGVVGKPEAPKYAAMIYSHKAILVCRSEYFRALFASGMKESSQDIIQVEDFDYDTFLGMMQHLYTGAVDRFRERRYQMFQIADRYNLKELRAQAEAFIRKDLDVRNAVEVLDFADRFGSDLLRNAALEMISRDLTGLLATDAFKKLVGDNDLLMQIFRYLAENKALIGPSSTPNISRS